ncbi:MAG: sugar phosphate isomerase/epimerase [Alistipes sp.]|jgi:sugar phosphate isomerase/epimerase|nr:sugar phosphate isomerase/epimerase [Alistipes sp.]
MKKITLLLVALSVAGVSLQSPAQVIVGVCTSIRNAQKLKDAGGDFIELSVTGFLQPQLSDDEWTAGNYAQALASPLPIYACNGFFPGNIKLTGPQHDHDAALEWCEVAFRRARQLGIRMLVLGSSGARNHPEGYDKATAVAEFTELLRRMGPVAGQYDVTVVLEPLRKAEANYMNTVAEGVAIVKAVGHENIRCLADIYHMLEENEGPEVLVAEREYIGHMHVAEKEGRSVPGTHGEDLAPYYNAMRRAGYRGGLSIEAGWRDFDAQIAPAIAELKKHTNVKSYN